MSLNIYDGRKNFYQYDTEQKLIIEDNNVCELHFSNDDTSSASVVATYEENGQLLCNVPNYFLQRSGLLMIYAVSKVNGEFTKKGYAIQVIPRKAPDDYVPEEEVLKWTTLEKEINNVKKSVEETDEKTNEKIISTITSLDLANVTEYCNENGDVFIFPEKEPSYITNEEFEEATKDFVKKDEQEDMIIAILYSGYTPTTFDVFDLITGDKVLSKTKIVEKYRKGLLSIVARSTDVNSETPVDIGNILLCEGLKKPIMVKFNDLTGRLTFTLMDAYGGLEQFIIPAEFLTD